VFAGGAVVLMHSRPLEGLLFFAVPAWWFIGAWLQSWRRSRATAVRLATPAALVGLAGVAVLLAANHAVTGSLWRMPYAAYEQQYSSTPNLIWERSRPAPADVPERFIQFEEEFARPNAAFTSPVLADWGRRLSASTRFLIGPALALAIIAAIVPGLSRWPRRALFAVLTCAVALALSYWYQLHYLAPAATAAVYLGIEAVRRLSRITRYRRRFLVAVGVLHIAAAVLMSDAGAVSPQILAAFRHRAVAERSLEAEGGQHLVFVSYDHSVSPHVEFVYNPLDLENARVIWARDLGAENARLLPHFPGRKLWRMRVSPTEVALQPLTAVPASSAPTP
jgi:hypothetical protein